jgi:ribose-phosphate pyrophosphokinase
MMIKLNGVEIKPTIFPDGTSQVWKIPKTALEHDYPSPVFKSHVEIKIIKKAYVDHKIEWIFESEGEFMHLVQLRTLLSQIGGIVCLYMPYLPYARQDKLVSNETTFARISFVNLLSHLEFCEISALDVHSNDRADQIINIFPETELDLTFEKSNPDIICYPDKGAKDRYQSYVGKFPTCSFSKDRDQETGYIKNLFLNEMVDLKDQDVLIIDDICDGGMTFKLCAEKLLQCGAKSVNLYTTHGIYSKGIQTLKDSGISRVFNRKGEVTDET